MPTYLIIGTMLFILIAGSGIAVLWWRLVGKEPPAFIKRLGLGGGSTTRRDEDDIVVVSSERNRGPGQAE